MSQPAQISLCCACGQVRGVARDVRPESGNRLVCYCDDCQAFAHHLGQAERVLDAHGGTDIFQMAPVQVTIDQGREHIRCLRLTPKGLLRWYAGCCNTPIGNTLAWAKFPFIGVIHSFMDHAADGVTRDQVLGPPIGWVQTKFAVGDVPAWLANSKGRYAAMRSLWMVGRHALRGGGRSSPVFEAGTGKPVVEPEVLSRAARQSLRPLCGQAQGSG